MSVLCLLYSGTLHYWCQGLPVQGVEGLLTALHVALKRLLLGVNTHVDLEAVGGEEGLSAALLVAHECVLAAVGLLVSPQVSRRAVRPGAALEHALVALHLTEEEQEGPHQRRNMVKFKQIVSLS